MKNIFYILLLLPTIIFAQYPSNSGHKITLGEQTTADGLVYRGVASIDTVTATSKITRANKQDTSAFILLDTVTNLLWHYKTASNGWLQAGGSTLDTATMLLPYWRSGRFSGVLPVANGGTNTSTAFTAGSVVFAGSGGTYTQANEDIRFIADSSRLVLGPNTILSTPPFNGVRFKSMGKIQIARSDEDTRFITIDNEGGQAKMNFGAPSPGYGSFKFTQSNNADTRTILFITGAGNLGVNEDVAANITQKLTVVGNGLFTQNLGVGGVTPTSRLHVKGVDGTSTNSALNVTNSSDASLLFVRNDGNVGIGTASPIYKLDINTGSDIVRINGTTGDRLLVFSSGNNSGINGLNFSSDLYPGLTFDSRSTDYGGVISKGRLLINSIAGGYGSGSLAGATTLQSDNTLQFSTGGFDIRLTISSTGNVGIGTASPTNGKLVVKSGESNSTGIVLERGSNTQKLVNIYSETADGKIAIASGANTKIFLNSVGDSYFTGGNVGIGTTSPPTKLSIFQASGSAVTADISLSGAVSAVNAGHSIDFKDSNNANSYARIAGVTNSTGTTGELSLWTSTGLSTAATEKVRINGNGNVGIGTATPQVTLEVFNSVNVPQFTVYNGTNWIILRGDAPLIGRTSGKDLLFLTYDTYPTTGANVQMTLQSNGKLKIVDLAGIGDIGADANGVLQAATSDMNLKNTIENSPFGLNEILLLNPVTFLYNDINRKLDSNIKEVGFIAQDVFDIIPNAVSSTGTGDLQLDYRAITATLTKAIQEQQAIIKALEQRIINLENK
jgi:hypothetical protein